MSSVLFSRLHIRDLLLLFILESYLANIQYSYRHISIFAKFVAYLIFERDILYNICVKHMVQWPKLASVTLERTPSQGTNFMNNVDISNWFAFGSIGLHLENFNSMYLGLVIQFWFILYGFGPLPIEFLLNSHDSKNKKIFVKIPKSQWSPVFSRNLRNWVVVKKKRYPCAHSSTWVYFDRCGAHWIHKLLLLFLP